jgi:hypothetical protein
LIENNKKGFEMKKNIIVCALVIVNISNVHAKNGGLGAMFAEIIGNAVGSVAGKSMADSQTIEKALVEITNKVNQRMPMTIDSSTRLDNVLGQNKRFTYNYTIVSAKFNEINKEKLSIFFTKLKAGICSSPDLVDFLKNGITVAYSYRASDGVFISKLEVTPKECGYIM